MTIPENRYVDPDPKLSGRRRREMITKQLEGRDIHDRRVLEAFNQVMRHEFVSEALYSRAYDDHALPIGFSQTISQPYMVAYMSQELRLEGTERVLEIGTGSGFQCAILSKLAKMVVSVERIHELYEKAKSRLLIRMRLSNVKLLSGNGLERWEAENGFDRILVTAGAPNPPKKLLKLLKPGGIMLTPIGNRSVQYLYRITAFCHNSSNQGSGDLWPEYPNFFFDRLIGCRFVPLVGPGAWEEK